MALETAARFATRMRKIPRTTVRCDVYGTVSIVVERKHATAILRKVVPSATSADINEALDVLQDRIDARAPVDA
jgi:hypothetical protein